MYDHNTFPPPFLYLLSNFNTVSATIRALRFTHIQSKISACTEKAVLENIFTSTQGEAASTMQNYKPVITVSLLMRTVGPEVKKSKTMQISLSPLDTE